MDHSSVDLKFANILVGTPSYKKKMNNKLNSEWRPLLDYKQSIKSQK